MLCKNPLIRGCTEWPCSKCRPCRINKVRLWIGRMMLETYEHPASAFVTLTFKPECCPDGLLKKDVQDFIKRLREAIEPRKIRYYAVGEYGDKTQRPHYHLVLFGVSPTEGELISRVWDRGFVCLGTVTTGSLAYTLGYVIKKMTKKGDKRLDGRPPEFALMSRKPGIGAGFIDRSLEAYRGPRGQAAIRSMMWVSESFKTEGKNYTIGRYLKGKLLDRLGFESGNREAHNELVDYENYLRRRDTTLGYIAKRAAKVTAEEGRYNARQKEKTL